MASPAAIVPLSLPCRGREGNAQQRTQAALVWCSGAASVLRAVRASGGCAARVRAPGEVSEPLRRSSPAFPCPEVSLLSYLMPADASRRLYTSQSGLCKSRADVRGVARPWSIAAMASRVLHHPRCPDPLEAIDAPPAQA